MWPETRERAELELTLLRRLLDTHRSLLEKVRHSAPNDIELSALAAILHSFYTGIESIFKRIALEIDDSFPSGEFSHSNLLRQMTQSADRRPAVISEELRRRLRDYLDFRHVFRHAYTFELKWRKMSDLVLHCEETLDSLELELGQFFSQGSS